jgi:hypothetical protein
MAQKPTPKELVVEQVGTRLIHIYTTSNDATDWVRREARDFGSLYEPSEHERHFTLFVIPTYEIEEVLAYLRSYSTQNGDGE